MREQLKNFKNSPKQRVFSLALIDGTGTGIQNAAVGVIAAQRFGIAAAGLVLGLGAAGRFASPVVFWLMDRGHGEDDTRTHLLFKWAVTAMTLMSVAVVASSIWSSMWLITIAGIGWSLSNSISTIVATTATPEGITGYGPVSIVGVGVGAWVAALILATQGGSITFAGFMILTAILLAQFFEIPLLSSIKFKPVTQAPVRETVRHAGKGIVYASITYGPLMIYQALTVQIASVNWVGWSMLTYAAGALLAIPASRKLTHINKFSTILLFGAAGVGVWMFAVNGPLLLATRFISGFFLFIGQGRLLRLAYESKGKASTSRLAGASTGLGLGASIGAVVAAELADQYTPFVMAAVLTVAALVTALAATLRHHIKGKKLSPSPS